MIPVSRAFERGDGHCWIGYVVGTGKGRGLCTRRTVASPSALSACSQVLERSAACATQLVFDLPPARSGCRTPGASPDPSLTQADRFLLVFRVCFCLAPFEIGYDVGGKAAASKPHAKSAQPQPVVSRKMDGQRVEKEGLTFSS